MRRYPPTKPTNGWITDECKKVSGKWEDKMDLRIEKTERGIKNAFIELRSRKPLEKITVKELCESARINKSTFYAHYKDIYDLSDAMEEEVVQSIANSIQHPEYLLEHSAEFARELLMAYVSQNSLTAILFSGSQANHFADSIERSIKQMIFEKYPEFREDTAMNVMLSFCIQGSYHAYQKNRGGDIMTMIDVIAGMTGAVEPMFEERKRTGAGSGNVETGRNELGGNR